MAPAASLGFDAPALSERLLPVAGFEVDRLRVPADERREALRPDPLDDLDLLADAPPRFEPPDRREAVVLEPALVELDFEPLLVELDLLDPDLLDALPALLDVRALEPLFAVPDLLDADLLDEPPPERALLEEPLLELALVDELLPEPALLDPLLLERAPLDEALPDEPFDERGFAAPLLLDPFALAVLEPVLEDVDLARVLLDPPLLVVPDFAFG